jgi:hypothetical protein
MTMTLFGETACPDPRDGPPPADQSRYIPVIRVHAGVGCRAQYSLPCGECDRGARRRWADFLPVLCWPGLAESVLELPEGAFYSGRDQNPAWHGCLRGRWFLLKRPVHPYSQWTVDVRESSEGVPDPLPPPPDVPGLLRRLWGLPEWATMKRHVHRPRDRRFGG